MSDVNGATDPFAQPGSDAGFSEIQTTTPGGGLQINEDGSAEIMLEEPQNPVNGGGHWDNLAEAVDPGRLSKIAGDLLDAIEIDKQAREKRDKQYEEGLRRTGLGDDAPGGATFPGASRAVHPVLTEACIDFSARVMSELLPPEGPVKAKTIGEPNNAKDDRAERTSRYMNLQLTELLPNVYYEFEMGFTQCPLGGAFYTKMIYDRSGISVVAVPIDKIHRPFSDGAIYVQPRITHEMDVDRWQFKENVRSGLWLDEIDPDTANDSPQQTSSEKSNDKVIGRTEPSQNIDNIRPVFETSMLLSLEDDDDPPEPYIVTVDEQTRKILSIYRNWQEDDDELKERLDFVIEWPFWPWRGGYPIGMSHMIGGLSGAATGAMRALLDAAFLNNSQTGVRLKGGATAGGQNIKAQPMTTTELQGSLTQDDVRKSYMPLPFPPPSPVLFQLLGFLVDAAKGVVRTTFDEYDKMGGQTPVGTAQMFIEQGLKNLGAVHGRLHRSMRRFLKQLWDINAKTINDQSIKDEFGEEIVKAGDFGGPMNVIPVSDPRIFSDMQRSAQAQMIVQRATDPVAGTLYNRRSAELYFLKKMNVSTPEQFLLPAPEPVQQNAVAENTTASNGMPIKAFPGQDHEAHLATHLAFMQSPLFGSNPIIATKYLPAMLPHIAEHVALWYADAMLDAANAALREKTGNAALTIESLAGPQYEAPLDRLLAELNPEVMEFAEERLGQMPELIAQAQELMKSLAPPMPMDPSIVAMKDVDRQTQADQQKGQLQLVAEQNKKAAADAKLQFDQRQQEIDAMADSEERQLKQAKLDTDREAQQRKDALAEQSLQLKLQQAREANQSREQIAADTTRSRETIADETNASREEIAEINAESKERIEDAGNETAIKVVSKKLASGSSPGNISTGTSLSE
jgi:chaperonin GroES